jgi:undecaprenyl-diphosphatase
LLEPTAERSPDDAGPSHPLRSAVVITVIGYVVLTALMLGIGLLLTHALDGSVGKWDRHVSETLARHRTNGWDDVTSVSTSGANTEPVVIAAAVVVGLLALRRRWREAGLLMIALFLEITVFLSVTFVVDRTRPSVAHLNSVPSTGSFPSGHTAAATVLCVGIALIVASLTRNAVLRALSWLLAAVWPLGVAYSRVYRGLHFPTDVFAGAFFGLACIAFAVIAVRAASRAESRKPASEETLDRRDRRFGHAL